MNAITVFCPYVYTNFNNEDLAMYLEETIPCKVENVNLLQKDDSKKYGYVTFETLDKDVYTQIQGNGFWVYSNNLSNHISKGQSKLLLVKYEGKNIVNGTSLRKKHTKLVETPVKKVVSTPPPIKKTVVSSNSWASIVGNPHKEEEPKKKVTLSGSTYMSYKKACQNDLSRSEMELLLHKLRCENMHLKNQIQQLTETNQHRLIDVGSVIKMREEEQNELLGNMLYQTITNLKSHLLEKVPQEYQPNFHIGKLVGMLLELDIHEKLMLIHNYEALVSRVQEGCKALSQCETC